MTYQFEATGTLWVIKLFNPLPYKQFAQLQSLITDTTQKLDLIFSRFNPESELSRLNTYKSIDHPSLPLVELITKSLEVEKITHGAFTPLIGSVMEAIGYDKNYTFNATKRASEEGFTTSNLGTITTLSNDRIALSEEAVVDVSAVAKGFIIDAVTRVVIEYGIHDFIMNAGGDIYVTSNNQRSVVVHVEHPKDQTRTIATYKLIDQSVCTSSNCKRTWIDPTTNSRQSHIQNASENILSVSVIADSATVADLLSTVLFITEEVYIDQLREMFNFTYYLYYDE